MTEFFLSQHFLVLLGVIVLMIFFKSRFQSTTDFLEKLKRTNHHQKAVE